LGKDRFREGQLEAVLAALRGESLLVVRPTGSGKSLCFQAPAVLRPGTTYVLSPLKALMADQVAELQRLKTPGTFINSDLAPFEKAARYDVLEHGALKFLYLTPERLDPSAVRDHGEIERLAAIKPTFLVVDEAHCVDRWGDDFRPSYGRLAAARKVLGNPPVLAFTATAGVTAQQRIIAGLGVPDATVLVSGVDRSNIALVRHTPTNDAQRVQIARHIIATARGKVMLFVPTRKVGDEVRHGLSAAGLDVPFYHGQLPQIEREFLLGQFAGRIHPEVNAIVCTNAFGMGLDIPNVRAVIHWSQPESVEDYLQEFGRAGRDGLPALAVIFKSPGDTGLRRFMAEKSAEQAAARGQDGEAALARKLEAIGTLDRLLRDRRRCLRRDIVRYFQGDAGRRTPLSVRVLDWLLGRRVRSSKAAFCCDGCDQSAALRALGLR
jgi:ATP-dependent DNA helicase RecQ